MRPSSCTSCYRRKLKCDRLSNGCSPCSKAKLPCIYKAPSPKGARTPSKRGPYKKYGSMREKELDRIVQVLQSRIDASTFTVNDASWTAGQLGTEALSGTTIMSTVAAASTGPEATSPIDGNELSLMLGEVQDGALSCHEPRQGSDPVFVEAAMLASLKPTPYITESSTVYLWHVFTDRVEPATRLVHPPSFTPVILAAARNGGWVADKTARLLVASIMFAAVNVLNDDDDADPNELCRTTLRRALRAEIDDMLSDPAIDATPSLYSLQAIALFLTMLRARGDDQCIGSLSHQARVMARRLAPLSTPFTREMHHRCWWSIVRVQNRCAEESLPLTRDNSWWDDFALPLNLNDSDFHPLQELTPLSRRGITDSTLLIVRLEMVRLINRISELLAGVPSHMAVKQCRDLASQTLQFLQHEYLQHADESRRYDGFLILTCKVLEAKVNLMILRQEIICSAYQPQVDALKDDMDDAAMTVLESSQLLLTDLRYKSRMWLYGSTHQAYVMAYILSRLLEGQPSKHGTRMRAFIAGLCWKSWLDRLDTAEHRELLAKFRSQVQDLDYLNAATVNTTDVFGGEVTGTPYSTRQVAATLTH